MPPDPEKIRSISRPESGSFLLWPLIENPISDSVPKKKKKEKTNAAQCHEENPCARRASSPVIPRPRGIPNLDILNISFNERKSLHSVALYKLLS